MDRIIFKKEIDRLYEKLYSINEGLSSDKSKELVRGFNDGIKEGAKLLKINEWNPFKAAAGTIGQVAGAAKGLYQQGKKIAGQVWSTVADFATKTLSKIKTGIETATQWVKTQPGKIKAYLEGVYNGVVTDMTSAYNTLKDKATELAAAIGKIWTDVTTTITTTITSIKASLIKTEQEAKAWFDTNKQIVIDAATSAATSTKEWLKEMGTVATDVATKVANGTMQALKGIGVVVAVITLGPIYLLYKGIMAVPDLYKATQTQVETAMTTLGNFWSQQKQEMGESYAAGWNKGMAKTGVPAPTGESRILKFSDFVNEKRKHLSKEEFLERIGKGKKKKKCEKCGKGKCEC